MSEEIPEPEIKVFYLYRECLKERYHCRIENDRCDQFAVIRKKYYDKLAKENKGLVNDNLLLAAKIDKLTADLKYWIGRENEEQL